MSRHGPVLLQARDEQVVLVPVANWDVVLLEEALVEKVSQISDEEKVITSGM